MLEFEKEVFDAMALFVNVCIERPVKAVVFAAGNHGDCAGFLNGGNGILSIIALVGNGTALAWGRKMQVATGSCAAT